MTNHEEVKKLIDESHMYAEQSVQNYHEKVAALEKLFETDERLRPSPPWRVLEELMQQRILVAHARADMQERYRDYYYIELKRRIYKKEGEK